MVLSPPTLKRIIRNICTYTYLSNEWESWNVIECVFLLLFVYVLRSGLGRHLGRPGGPMGPPRFWLDVVSHATSALWLREVFIKSFPVFFLWLQPWCS